MHTVFEAGGRNTSCFAVILVTILVLFWCRFGAILVPIGGSWGGWWLVVFFKLPGGVQGRPGADKVRQIQGRGAFFTFLRDKN